MNTRHPGEILYEDFLLPRKLSMGRLAALTGMEKSHIYQLKKKKINITPNTAMRLGVYFKTGMRYWLLLQVEYDVALAESTGLFKAVENSIAQLAAQHEPKSIQYDLS